MGNQTFVSDLLRNEAHVQLDFVSTVDFNEILSIVCANLNEDGGYVIVGYTKKGQGGPIIPDTDEQDIRLMVSEKILPHSLVYIQSETYKQHIIILISVHKGSRSPYSYEGKVYVRRGKRIEVASPDEISLMLRGADQFSTSWEKLTAIDASFKDLISDQILKTIERALKYKRKGNLPDDPEQFLGYFQLVDMGIVRNGAVILFGKDPQVIIPQCRIRITVMPLGKTADIYEDSQVIETNLFQAHEELNSYFSEHLPTMSFFSQNEWQRTDRTKYPLDALDEALINALVHRDYSDVSGEIHVDIYADRIVMVNSGEIPQGILKSKSNFELYHPVFRNPMIAHIFFLRGLMEKKGRGLPLIKERCKEFGLRAPEWISENGFTTLTIFGFPKKIELSDRMLEYLETNDKPKLRPFSTKTTKNLYEKSLEDRRKDVLGTQN